MILTKNIMKRADWFQASARVDGKYFFDFATTRSEAFSSVLWQIAQHLRLPV